MDPPRLPPFRVSNAPPPPQQRLAPSSSSLSVPSLSTSDDSDDDEADGDITVFPAPNSAQRIGALKPSPQSKSGLMAPASSTSASLLPKSASAAARARAKVALKPGHSPMDWVRLTNSGANLRGIDAPGIVFVSAEELKKHNTLDDMWTALGGKVYNVTPYVPFHPGGEKILRAAAGRDGTALFMKTHAWVSFENILAKTMVGIYRP